MLYTVEVPLSGDVGKVMSNMRTWLGQQRFEPDSFRQIENDGAQPRFRLEFQDRPRGRGLCRGVWGTRSGNEEQPWQRTLDRRINITRFGAGTRGSVVGVAALGSRGDEIARPFPQCVPGASSTGSRSRSAAPVRCRIGRAAPSRRGN